MRHPLVECCSSARAQAPIHTPPGTAPLSHSWTILPALTSLDQAHPSSFRSESASSQQRGGEASVRPSPHPHPTPPSPAGSAHTPCKAWDACTSTACDCTETEHMKERGAPSQPHGSSPGPQVTAPPPLVSNCPRVGWSSGCQGRLGTGLCGLKLTLPSPPLDQTLQRK